MLGDVCSSKGDETTFVSDLLKLCGFPSPTKPIDSFELHKERTPFEYFDKNLLSKIMTS
jgi:hypothetical protein